MSFPTLYANIVGGYGVFTTLTAQNAFVALSTVTAGDVVTPGIAGTTGTAGIYSGTGVPSNSAPNGSLFLSYTNGLYINESGSGTSGTTWVAASSGSMGVTSLSTSGAIFTTLSGATGAVTIAAPYAVDTINAQTIGNVKTFSGGIAITGSSSLTSEYPLYPGQGGTVGTAAIYSGSGVPAFSAPQGSIFLSANGNCYINTAGTSTWTTFGTSSSGVSSISTSGAIFTTLSGATGAVTIAAPNAVDTTSTQTIGGTKTFSNAISVAGVTSTAPLTPGYSGTAGSASIYSGSGSPSFSANQGSLFLSSNGSAYVNTSSGSGTTWTLLQSGSGAVTGVTATSPLASSGGTAPVISISSSPTFSGTVTANQFTGSGAGLTSGTVPNAALVTTPINVSSTSQTKSGTLIVGALSSNGTISATTGITAGGTLGVTGAATVGGGLTVLGAVTFSTNATLAATSVTTLALSGALSGVSASFSGNVTAAEFIGSGAGLTSGTVPNAALVTTPLDTSSTSQTKTGALTAAGLTSSTTISATGNASVGGTLTVTGVIGSSSTVTGVNGEFSGLVSGTTASFGAVSGTTGTFSGTVTAGGSFSSAGIFNVLVYGADPTGVADSTTAIQNALNAAGGVGTVLIPQGTYKVNGHPELSVPSNSDIQLEGTLLNPTGSNQALLTLNSVSNVRIWGTGTLNANGGASNNSACILATDCTNVVIDGISLLNPYYFSASLYGMTNCTLRDVKVDSSGYSGGTGPGFSGNSSNPSVNCWFERCTITNTHDEAVSFYGNCQNCGVRDSFISGAVYGISILNDSGQPTPSNGIIIENNTVTGCTYPAILVETNNSETGYHQNILIRGNHIYSNTANSMYLVNGSDMIVANNICHTNNQGIYLGYQTSPGNIALLGNLIYNEGQGGTSGYGIEFSAAVPNVTIQNNTFYDTNSGSSRTMSLNVTGSAGANLIYNANGWRNLISSGTGSN